MGITSAVRNRIGGDADQGSEQGASLVEFTLVSVLLFTLLFGIIEFGLAFRDRLTISNATQTAGRVGSALGDADRSDYEVLKSLEQSLNTLPNSGLGIVNYVDIFSAAADGSKLSSCPGAKCNRYYWQPGATATCDWSPCPEPDATGNVPGGWGGSWLPSGRDVELPGLEVMGVELAFAHNWVTNGLVPLPDVSCTDGTFGTNCWKDTALMRLEPQQFAP